MCNVIPFPIVKSKEIFHHVFFNVDDGEKYYYKRPTNILWKKKDEETVLCSQNGRHL